MANVGFIGLGAMGAPMAKNLLQAGHRLFFHARRPEVIDAFRAAGAHDRPSPAAVAEEAETIITIVTADPQVEEVALGPEGIAQSGAAGRLLIDMSTIGPETARRVAAGLAQRGIDMLDAPVSGGPWGAEAAALTIMVGGEPDAYARALPLFQALGKRIEHVGPLGAGQTVKLVNQMVAGAIMALVGEGFSVARRAGVDLEKLADIMQASSGNSAVFEARGKKFILAGNYAPGFKCQLMHKDMSLAVGLAHRLGVPTPVAASALQLYTAALNQGYGAEDFAAVAKVCAEAAGVALGPEAG